MQKKLFQTLLIAAIIGASVGQTYAQQGGSCTVSAPTPTPPKPPKPPKNIPKSDREAWEANWIANWIANWNANYYNNSCDTWAVAECPSANNGVCLTDYKSECPWCFCVCSPTSPDKRVERHQEVVNKNSDAKGNASE